MGKSLKAELREPRGKADPGALGIERRLVTNHTHPAFLAGEVLRVTIITGRVAGQDRRGVIAWARVASRAVLRPGFVLFSVMIERRIELDDLRLNDVKGRLAHGRRSRRGAFGGFVQVLFRAAARPQSR